VQRCAVPIAELLVDDQPRLRDERRQGIQVEEGQSLQDMDEIAAANGRLKPDLYGEINRMITNRILENYSLSREFRTAIAMLCWGRINPQNVTPTDAEIVKLWLLGEKCSLTALKRMQIYQRIARNNASLLLGSLALWLSEVGYAGLALLLDLNAVVADYAPGVNLVRYTRSTVLDTYEVLRQFIDDTDELFSACGLCSCAATGLTTGAVTGILDRLEKAGLVERYRNAIDRRKVFVRPRMEALQRIGRLYEGLATASLKHASGYSTKELELIKDYLEGSLRVLRDQSAKFT